MTRQLDIYGHPYSLIVYIFIWLQEDSNFLAPAKATIDLPSLCCKEKTCLRESKSTECLLLLVRYSSLLKINQEMFGKPQNFTKLEKCYQPFCQNNSICVTITIYNAPSHMNSKIPLKQFFQDCRPSSIKNRIRNVHKCVSKNLDYFRKSLLEHIFFR